MSQPAPVQVRIDRVIGTKAARGCRIAKARRRFRKVGTLSQLPTQPTAAGRRLALTLRLKPGQYRITVRAHLDHNRLSPPARSSRRVLG
jgi:hypothetical protein